MEKFPDDFRLGEINTTEKRRIEYARACIVTKVKRAALHGETKVTIKLPKDACAACLEMYAELLERFPGWITHEGFWGITLIDTVGKLCQINECTINF